MEEIKNEEDFEKKVLKKSREKPVIVDFWAEWCLPCKKLGPKIEKCGEKMDSVDFFKVNIDELPEVSEKFEIKSIPHVILFLDGKKKNSFSGVMETDEIIKWVEEII